MPTNQSPHALIPVISLLLSACMWGVLWYPLRILEGLGLPGLWSTLTIFGTALCFSLTLVIVQRRRISSHPLLLLVMAAASGWCNVAFILAVLDGNVVRITLLFYLSPIWTVLLGRLILAERMDRQALFTLAFAVCGALTMLWDSDLGFPWPQDAADWLAISSGVGFALSNVMVRKLYDEDIWVKTVFAWVGVVVLAGVWLLLGQTAPATADVQVIELTILIGGVAIICMTLLVLYGLTHMPAHRAAVILLFELIAGAVSAELLTDEVVLLREWVGGCLIIIAGYVAARRQLTEKAETVGAT